MCDGKSRSLLVYPDDRYCRRVKILGEWWVLAKIEGRLPFYEREAGNDK